MTTTIRRSVALVGPASEPVSLTEAKKQLEIATADTTHDTHVGNLIEAARLQWEHDTQSLTVARNIVEKLEDWPDDCWRFYFRPVASIGSITYYDAANSSQTLSASIYTLDAPNRKIRLAYEQNYPAIAARWDAVTITYSAGQTTVGEISKAAILLMIDFLFELRGPGRQDKESVYRAYENLVARYCRSDYP